MQFFIKFIIVMGVLLAVYHLLLHREKMYRFNRFYLVGALVASLVLPFVDIPVYMEAEQPVTTPALVKEILTETAVTDIPAHQVAPVQAQELPASMPYVNYWSYIILGIYALITLAFIIRFIVNIGHFYTIKRRSKIVKFKGATLVLTEDNVLPHTFLNNIYLNKEHFEKLQVEPELLTHELTHVRQRHTLDILFVEVLKAIMWFNPLLYLYKKAIQLNHEFLADEAVIKKHKNVAGYQELLLTKATPSFNYALSSSINFSLTKKRFAMMTKTTNLAKAIILKAITALVTTGLLYVVCVKTVTYAKEMPAVDKAIVSTPMEEVENSIAEDFIEEIVPVQEMISAVTDTDTVTGDARRDEYYKGVRIVIEDKLRNVYLDKPYEKLSPDQKDLYIANAPSIKGSPDGISVKDYEWYIGNTDGIFYIDDRKVTREEVLKHKREHFASSGFRFTNVGKKETKQIFLYTYPYYNKHIKHSNDHYPESTYKVTILDKPVDTYKLIAEENKRQGVSDLSQMEDELNNLVSQPVYPREEEHKRESRESSPRFPGDKNNFMDYFSNNFKEPAEIKRKELSVMFAINTDGSLSDITVLDKTSGSYSNITSSPEYKELTKEIERVMTNSPRWTPAQRDGVPVKMSTTINITVGNNK